MHWNIRSSIGSGYKFHEPGFANNQVNSTLSEFYEIEEAVVLDVIHDETHPDIGLLVASEWPDNHDDKIADVKDKNYTYIGRILFRMLNSQIGLPREKLSWAKPMYSTGVVEIPLLNEIVLIHRYRNEWYYTRKLNLNGFINNNASFHIEKTEGNTSGNRLDDDSNSNFYKNVEGVISSTGPSSILTAQNRGVMGSYFKANNKIRSVKKFEGDTTIESRHGQSIRMSAYDNTRSNDIGDGRYTDYRGCGNPMILIRNRQRPLGNTRKDTQLHPLLPVIGKIKDVEKNAGGILQEDINNDGSSIHITSGKTISTWKTTVYKSIFSITSSEEQSNFSPPNATKFAFPELSGDQIVINSDRLILSSRFNETLHFSKKRYAVMTDDEYTVDSQGQIVLTTNDKTVINSPVIYLGQFAETNEPALLGQTTVDWLYDLCEWLKTHTHWYNHTHPRTGNATPNSTQIPMQIAQLQALQSSLNSLLSRRVFLTGGGYAPGQNGGKAPNSDSIHDGLVINTTTGAGVPGGFHGQNSRKQNKQIIPD